MSRIRTIKPEFQQSESIGKLSRDARLLFIELWPAADDFGKARAASRMLASLLFPYDDDAPSLIDGWLMELEENGLIRRYEADDTQYLEICNWLKHQKIDHPSPSKLPEFREPSREFEPRACAPDLGPRTKEDSSLRSESSASASKKFKPPKLSALEILKTALSEKTAQDLIDHRKAKRAPLTPRAAELLAAAFRDHGDPECCAEAMIVNGWQGFKPEWMAHQIRAGPNRTHQGPITAFNRPSMREYILKADREAQEAKQKLLDLMAQPKVQENDQR